MDRIRPKTIESKLSEIFALIAKSLSHANQIIMHILLSAQNLRQFYSINVINASFFSELSITSKSHQGRTNLHVYFCDLLESSFSRLFRETLIELSES